MNIAVADEGGNIVGDARLDNAGLQHDIALKKAYTSRAFDIERRNWQRIPNREASSSRSCFKQRQNHDFLLAASPQAGRQGSRGDWRQRWFPGSGSCPSPQPRCRVLTRRTETYTRRLIMCIIILALTSAFPWGSPLDFTDLYAFPNRETLGNPS